MKRFLVTLGMTLPRLFYRRRRDKYGNCVVFVRRRRCLYPSCKSPSFRMKRKRNEESQTNNK